MLRSLLVSLLLLAGPAALRAGVDRWTSSGPDGGFVGAFAIDPVHTSTLYAATQVHLYKSTDAGTSWQPLSAPRVSVIAVSPTNSNVIYTSDSRSSDAGATWTRMGEIVVAGDAPRTGSIRALAVDARDSNTVYAGFETGYTPDDKSRIVGAAKSTDGGLSWAIGFTVEAASDNRGGILGFAVTTDRPTRIYEAVSPGVSGFAIYVSGDGGTTWSSTPVGPWIYNLAAGSGLLAYAGTFQNGVLKTSDGGATWLSANVGLPDAAAAFVAVEPSNPSTIYAATSGGLFRSTNAAASWTLVNPDQLGAITFDPSHPEVLYSWGPKEGVLRSDDGGTSWSVRSGGIHEARVFSVGVDPSNPLTVFAGESGSIDISHDGGSSWTRSTAGVPDAPIADVLVDPTDSRFVYATVYTFGTAPGALLRSTDGGVSWTPSTNGLHSVTYGGSLASSTDGTIFAGTSSGVFRSLDRGLSWTGSLRDRQAIVVRVNPSDGRVWAGTEAGLYSSSDGGATWTLEAFEGLVIYAFDAVGTSLFAQTADGLWKLVPPHGWQLATAGIPTFNGNIRIDRKHPDHIYVSNSEGVYQSSNGGAGWSSMNNGNILPDFGYGALVGDFEIDSSGTRLYAAGYPGGVSVYERSRRIVLPAAASLHGIAPAYFHSDAALFNASDAPATVTATYRCFADSCSDPVRTLAVPPRQSLPVDDIVAQLFGEPETGGAIELDSDQPILVTSRLYTPEKPAPTLGMFVPGLRPEQSYAESVLTSLSHSSDLATGSRTNVGVFNPYEETQAVTISLFDPAGTKLGTIERSLEGHDALQINDADLWTEAGAAGAVPSFYAVVRADTAVFAYAAVIDNQSQDPIFVTARELRPFSSVTVIPAASSIHGVAGSFFHSDVSIVNLTDPGNEFGLDAFVQLSASCFFGSCPGAAASLTLAPGHSVLLEDVLGSTFNLPETGAAIEITSAQPIAVTSRLYTPSHPDPTVGMFVPGLSPAEGASPAVLSSLSYSPGGGGSRVNVGAYNGGYLTRQVRLRLYRGSGELLGETGQQLVPGMGVQFNDFFRSLGITEDVATAYCVVDADEFGPLYSYAAVIDNQSQDPIFIIGLPDPAVVP